YRTHFYGTDSSYSEKSVRQVYRTYDALVYFKNAQPNKANIDIKQTLNFNYLQETFGKAHEWFIAGQTDFQKTFKQYHSIIASFNFDISDLKNDSLTLQRNLFTPMVGYGFNNDDWKAWGKFGVTIDGKTPVFVTDVHIEKRLYEHAIIAYLEYNRRDKKNSLESLAQVNPYIQHSLQIKNSPTGDFGAGFKGTAQNLSYNLAFHLFQVKNMPFFINDSTDAKRFVSVYDNNTLVYNFHFEAGYNVKEWLRFLVMGDYNYYHLHTQAQPWYQPAFTGVFRANYIWKNKISATLDVYGLTNSNALLPEGQVRKIKGTADINLGFEYFFSRHVSFFATLNNIANIKYQSWYHYPTYGINGMVGGKFSF
ncbi:MAG TPA: TonB-dependent receptor, partial [Chitinophagales bacterium]|nr:TonB-dependent receptor [Chitinophagales bacterium]